MSIDIPALDNADLWKELKQRIESERDIEVLREYARIGLRAWEASDNALLAIRELALKLEDVK